MNKTPKYSEVKYALGPRVVFGAVAGLAVLALALGLRLFWLACTKGKIGVDAVRYLWISEHLSRGEWSLFPQVWTSPLLPGAIGLLSLLTGENLWTGRILCVLGNTLAVGLAILLFRRVAPERPAIAWLVGLGLAVNRVWCQLAVTIVTENFFYPVLMALWLAMLRLKEKNTSGRGLVFGAVWGLLYLAREIGLYYGTLLFILLAGAVLWENGRGWQRLTGLAQFGFPVLSGLMMIAGGWVLWLSLSLGTFSLGEGPKIYMAYELARQRGVEFHHYENGTYGILRYKPWEIQEYTRFPRPGEDRFPRLGTKYIWTQLGTMPQRVWKNFGRAMKEFERVTAVGLFMVGLVLPAGVILQKISCPPSLGWLGAASGLLLGLHLIATVDEARLLGWFFPWLYFGLATALLWLWDWLHTQPLSQRLRALGSVMLVALFLVHAIYPNIRPLPKLWQLRHVPQVQKLAAEEILRMQGPGAVISSQRPEVAYWGKAFWIGQPYGNPAELVEWLYLGSADYFLLVKNYPCTDAQIVFWADPNALRRQYPELELVTEYDPALNPGQGQRARLFRFHPRAEKLAHYRQHYPWAGTRPR